MARRKTRGDGDRPRIYLAGPEVFHPEARRLGEAKALLCRDFGFDGVFPLDTALDLAGLPKSEQARRIYLADIALMDAADLAICNLTPFRGVSMDSGTAFEAGYMRAQGKIVLGYSNIAEDYRTRAQAFRHASPGLPDADRPDIAIEDFALAENLMIEIAIRESGGRVICRSVPAGRELEDLEAFRDCLALARALVLDT